MRDIRCELLLHVLNIYVSRWSGNEMCKLFKMIAILFKLKAQNFRGGKLKKFHIQLCYSFASAFMVSNELMMMCLFLVYAFDFLMVVGQQIFDSNM